MLWLCRFSIRNPKAVIVAGMLFTLAIAPGVMRLTIRTDGHALVPSYAPEIALDREIRDAFRTEDPIIILIRTDHPNGLFNANTLNTVQRLTVALSAVDGVRPEDLFSLATEYGDRVWPGTLKFRRFLEPMPTTDEELARLRRDLEEIELFTGTLVSYDRKATQVLVGVPKGADRSEFLRTVRQVVEADGEIRDRIDIIGAPVAEALLGTHILEDLGVPAAILGHRTMADHGDGGVVPLSLFELRQLIARTVGLVPIAIAIMAGVFFLFFRSVAATMLPLMEVGACLAVVFGLMGWLGVPVYLTIAVLPVILTAIGIADEIHIFSRYRDGLTDDPAADHIAVLTATMDEMWVPVVKTSVTTAVGFLSFALSPIGPVRAFGIFTAVGIVFCMLWSLTVIPACLAILGADRIVGRRGQKAPRAAASGGGWFGRFAPVVMRGRFVVLAVAALIAVATPFGVRRIVVQDSWIDGFAPEGDFHKAMTYFNEQFLGMHLLLLRVDVGGTEFVGELPAEAIAMREFSLPATVVKEPDALVGYAVRLTVDHGPAPPIKPVDGEDAARPDGEGPKQSPEEWDDFDLRTKRRIERYRRRPVAGVMEWNSWIDQVARSGDRLTITTLPRNGSPKAALRLGGGETVTYRIRSQRLMDRDVLELIGELETFIEDHGEYAVGGVIGTADYLSTIHFMSKARREGTRRIPDRVDKIDWLWRQYKKIRGPQRHAQIVNSDYSRSLVTVFLKNANYVDTAGLLREIRAFEAERLRPAGISLDLAGDVAVSQTLIGAIVSTQVRSVLISLVGIVIVTALLGRSLRMGIYCVLPCAFAVSVNFAVMGWVGVPLGVATSMFAGMTLGIAVDYAIHLLERYRRAVRNGKDVSAAVSDAIEATGPAIMIDAIAVAAGFGILTLSQVPANVRLGGLVLLSILGSLAATMFVLPALLRVWPLRQTR